MILATGNPTPPVATFNFGPAAGSQAASTRIRLAKTQDVVALAKMADGSVVQASSTVKVTIGGCGG
jgi:sulfur-oxidizing protein SoxY